MPEIHLVANPSSVRIRWGVNSFVAALLTELLGFLNLEFELLFGSLFGRIGQRRRIPCGWKVFIREIILR